MIAMGRNAGFAAAVNRGIGEARGRVDRDSEQRRRTRSRTTSRRLAAAPAWFATGKILDARRNGTIDGTFDLTCRGRHDVARGERTRRWSACGRSHGKSASAPWTAAVYRADVFRQDRPARGALRIVSRGCRFRPAMRGAGDRRQICSRGGRLASRQRDARPLASGHGAPDRAQSGAGSRRVICRRAAGGRWWSRRVCGAVWRCVTAPASAWAQGIIEGVSGYRAMRLCGPGLRRILSDNERSIAELQAEAGPDSVLEVVPSAHQVWGKVTHGRNRNRHRHV